MVKVGQGLRVERNGTLGMGRKGARRGAASCGERWRDLGCRMRDAGARTALFPQHTKGLVRDRTAVHLDDLGILGLPLPALSAPAGLLIPEPLGFQVAGVGGSLCPELTLKCA